MRTTNTQTLRTGKAAGDRAKLPTVLQRQRRRDARKRATRTLKLLAAVCANVSPMAAREDLARIVHRIGELNKDL